jgi:hypothetical protein
MESSENSIPGANRNYGNGVPDRQFPVVPKRNPLFFLPISRQCPVEPGSNAGIIVLDDTAESLG